jgi:thiol-disulfide isomerase/thioredoxin
MKNLLLGLFLLSGLFSCARQDGFVIHGKIQGKDSGSINLLKYVDGKLVTEDSAKIDKGSFELKGKTDLPEMRLLAFDNRQPVAQFFVENGDIYIKANMDSLNKAEIKGSKSNDQFAILTGEMMNLNKETGLLQQRYMSAQSKGDEMSMNQVRADYEAMIQNQKVYVRNFIREHPKSTVSPLAALMQFSQELTAHDVDTLVKFLDPSIKSSIYIAELKKIADRMRVTEVGSLAPDFTLNTPEGKPLSLSSLRGKIVLVDFWASWCQPCRRENPNVVAVYNKYKDKGFDIIGVSLDKEKTAWVKAIADDNLTWNQVSDLKFWQSDVAVKYGIQSIPSSVLLDKDGKIIAKNLRGEELGRKLTELLGQ